MPACVSTSNRLAALRARQTAGNSSEVDVMGMFDIIEEDAEEEKEGEDDGVDANVGNGREYQGVGAPPDPLAPEVLQEHGGAEGGTLDAEDASGLGGRPRGEPRESFIVAGAAGGLAEEEGVRRALESLRHGHGRPQSVN